MAAYGAEAELSDHVWVRQAGRAGSVVTMRGSHGGAPVGRTTWRRSGGLVVAAVLVGLGLTACGGTDETPASESSTSSDAGSGAAAEAGGYPFDTATTGDDLLQT